jgi:hypothetical protein
VTEFLVIERNGERTRLARRIGKTWSVQRFRRTRQTADAGLHELDTGEMTIRLAAIDQEESRIRARCLEEAVRPLVERQVPARHVDVADGIGAIRLRFADGTALLARGRSPGDIGVLVAMMRERSIVPTTCATDTDGTTVTLSAAGSRRRVAIRIVGLDQPS